MRNGREIRKHGTQSGYSFPELLIVVAIIGMFVLFGGPALNSAVKSYRVRSAANGLANDLRAQRYLAVSNRGSRSVTINRQDHSTAPNQYTFVNPQGRSVTVRLDLVTVDTASATSVPFNMNGSTGTAGNINVVLSNDITATRGERYTVTVTPTGTVQTAFATYVP
ncbi:MAG: pilus assembly FimT family protein [Candidatus Polarisedimenticolia bacterium]